MIIDKGIKDGVNLMYPSVLLGSSILYESGEDLDEEEVKIYR